MSNILSSWLPHTHEEAGVVASTSDISFVHNISEGYKMEMASELAHDMFKVAFMFSLVSTGPSGVLVSCISFKEMEI